MEINNLDVNTKKRNENLILKENSEDIQINYRKEQPILNYNYEEIKNSPLNDNEFSYPISPNIVDNKNFIENNTPNLINYSKNIPHSYKLNDNGEQNYRIKYAYKYNQYDRNNYNVGKNYSNPYLKQNENAYNDNPINQEINNKNRPISSRLENKPVSPSQNNPYSNKYNNINRNLNVHDRHKEVFSKNVTKSNQDQHLYNNINNNNSNIPENLNLKNPINFCNSPIVASQNQIYNEGMNRPSKVNEIDNISNENHNLNNYRKNNLFKKPSNELNNYNPDRLFINYYSNNNPGYIRRPMSGIPDGIGAIDRNKLQLHSPNKIGINHEILQNNQIRINDKNGICSEKKGLYSIFPTNNCQVIRPKSGININNDYRLHLKNDYKKNDERRYFYPENKIPISNRNRVIIEKYEINKINKENNKIYLNRNFDKPATPINYVDVNSRVYRHNIGNNYMNHNDANRNNIAIPYSRGNINNYYRGPGSNKR